MALATAPSSVRNMRDRVGELVNKIRGGELHPQRVRSEGFPNLSALMEHDDPSDADERYAGFDAFQRGLMVAEIRTQSDAYGTYSAHPVSRMAEEREGGSIDLFAEWSRRQWYASRKYARMAARMAAQQRMQSRANPLFMSGDYLPGSIQAPYDDDDVLRIFETQPAVPLAEIVARTRSNAGADYRSMQLVQPVAADIRLLRIGEGAEIPKTVLATSARSLHLPKFGRGLEASYEAARRIGLDDFAIYLRLLAIQNEVDQVAAAADVAINGDGNAGTSAAVFNLTALDPATTANNLTVNAWLAFETLWLNPYSLTTVLGNQAAIIKMLTLNMGTQNLLTSSALVPDPLRTTFVPISGFTSQGIRYGILPSAPANRLIGMDARFALEHVMEAGSEISEAERWVHRQTETLYFTMNEGFAVFLTGVTNILRLDA